MAKSSQSNSSYSKTTGKSYTKYKDNKNLYNQLKKAEQNAPKYQDNYKNLMTDALNRVNQTPTFDASSNPVFQQYQNDYRLMGNVAAAQSEAQTEALSGGFGTTYGGAVANQALQGYLANENDIIPALLQQEKANARADQANALNEANLYNALRAQDYSMYQGVRDLWNANREYAYNKWYNDMLAHATSVDKNTQTDRSSETATQTQTVSGGRSGRKSSSSRGSNGRIGTVSSYNGLRKKLIGEGYDRKDLEDLMTRQEYVTARAKQDRNYNAGWTGGLSKSDPDYDIKKKAEDDVDLDYYEYLNKYYRNKRKGK